MVELYSVVGVLLGIFIIFVTLLKLKNQSISQGTVTIWLIVGSVSIIIASVPFAIFTIQALLGTEVTLSAVFGISFVFLTLLIFFLHQKIDSMNQKITKLVSKLGADEYFKSSKKGEN